MTDYIVIAIILVFAAIGVRSTMKHLDRMGLHPIQLSAFACSKTGIRCAGSGILLSWTDLRQPSAEYLYGVSECLSV